MAISALTRAAELTTGSTRRAVRLLRAAELAAEMGDQAAIEQILRRIDATTLPPQQRTRMEWIRESLHEGVPDNTAGVYALAELAERTAADGDTELGMTLLWGAAIRCFWAEPGQDARERVSHAADTVPADRRSPLWLAIKAFSDPLGSGRLVIDELERLVGQPDTIESDTNGYLGDASTLVGAYHLTDRLHAVPVRQLRVQGRLGLAARALCTQSWSAVHRGDLTTAIPVIDEAVALAEETGQPLIRAMAESVQALVAALRGDHKMSDALAASAEEVALPIGASAVLSSVQWARGVTASSAGRYSDAFAHLARMFDPNDPAYQGPIRCFAIGELAEAAVRSGQSRTAERLVEEVDALAATSSSEALHAGIRYARALLSTDDAAEARYEQALRLAPRNFPFGRARTQLAYGQWLRRARRVAESRPHLRAARETFDALGTIPWGDRARRELRASGEKSRRRAWDVRDELTAQELQIAQLAATGMSNKEIGLELFVSHRTIGAHLYRIFPKLGISSRSELAVSLASVDHRN